MRRLGLAWCVVVLGCDAGASVAPVHERPLTAADIAGTYVLKTIVGEPLPWTMAEGATTKTEVLADTMVLTAAATFTRRSHSRRTVDGVAQMVLSASSGTFSHTTEGGSAVLTYSGSVLPGEVPFTMSGVVSGTVLTMHHPTPANPWVYQR